MNILPKKRWHVRTKQNIERVRRDEAKAAEEEKELKRRIRLAEQEARTEYLRKKARSVSELEQSKTSSDFNIEHINFFQELEKNAFTIGKNKEHEAEEKARQEKFEKDLGILTYLGQNSLEAKGETPWYLKSQLKELVNDEKDGKEGSLDMKHKAKLDKMDPLNDMKKYLAIKEKKHVENSKQKEKDSKVHKHHKAESSSSSRKLSKIEELRAKRLKREVEEKRRSQEFLQTLRKGKSSEEEVILDDRLRNYNSQFNPHLARNNLLHDREY